jgi:hypothetical protein
MKYIIEFVWDLAKLVVAFFVLILIVKIGLALLAGDFG